MAQYPNLSDHAIPQDPCPPYDDAEDSSSDDEFGANVLEGFMYDDHGALVPVCEPDFPDPTESSVPAAATVAAATSPPSAPIPATQIPRPVPNMSSGRRELTLAKDAHGKIGIKLTRMGPRMFFCFVEKNSNAAKCGLGFGDQLLKIEGADLSRMSGTRLMSCMAHSNCREFKVTVLRRPFDFELLGLVSANQELSYWTKQGKHLGSVKITRVAKEGCLKNLKLLEVNGQSVFCCKESVIKSILCASVGQQIILRVMPVSLYGHLMRRQNKDVVKNLMQLSPRIL